MTTLLPTVFAAYTILAAAWADSGGVTDGGHAGVALMDECDKQATGHAIGGVILRIIESWCKTHGAVAGRTEMEEWALWAMTRAFGALGALIERVLKPVNMDAVEVVITIVSMSTVAFITWPTYFTLAEAERTYQVMIQAVPHTRTVTVVWNITLSFFLVPRAIPRRRGVTRYCSRF